MSKNEEQKSKSNEYFPAIIEILDTCITVISTGNTEEDAWKNAGTVLDSLKQRHDVYSDTIIEDWKLVYMSKNFLDDISEERASHNLCDNVGLKWFLHKTDSTIFLLYVKMEDGLEDICNELKNKEV